MSGYQTVRRDGHRAVVVRPGILHMPVDDIRDAHQRVIGGGLKRGQSYQAFGFQFNGVS